MAVCPPLKFNRRDVSNRSEQPPVVKPVHPPERGVLHGGLAGDPVQLPTAILRFHSKFQPGIVPSNSLSGALLVVLGNRHTPSGGR